MTTLNSGIPTFISGPAVDAAARSLFAVGPVVSTAQRSLFASGPVTNSGEVSVFTSGPVPETSSSSLFTAGPYPASGQSTLFSVSGGINNSLGPLYLQTDTVAGGGETKSDALFSLYASGSNFAHSDSDQGIAPLRIEAPIKSGVSSDSTLFMQTVPEVLPTPSGVSPKFNQPLQSVNPNGSWEGYLVYNDAEGMTTTADGTNVGKLNIGSVYFTWTITQTA